MSRFLSEKYSDLKPYVPGEQPRDRRYIKLNTNESPFPPSPKAQAYAAEAAKNLQVYSDPECTAIREKMAQLYGLTPEQVFFGNGSDEALYLAFLCFCDQKTPAVFPDITYGFYKVFAQFLGIPYTQIPLQEDFTIDVNAYLQPGKTIFIANPNAPTGVLESVEMIEEIVKANPDVVVIVDEAYIDFGGVSCLPLIEKYENLLVVQTFSKSRSMAGMRIGFAMGSEKLIGYLNDAKFSFNSYTMNMTSQILGAEAVRDNTYFKACNEKIIATRERTKAQLKELGFTFPDSKANFVFAKHNSKSGAEIFNALKERNIYIRYWNKPRIADYLRITIGTDEQMEKLVAALQEILEQ